MKELKIYQIGLGSFGRYGFEKIVELHNHFEEIDVRLCGVSEKDFDRLEAAEKFASHNGVELETFSTARELYEAAKEEEGQVMVYDAGPAEAHSEHIYRSLQNGFYHLAEKPPSLTRENHRKEKELARDRDVFYKVDFIERESPVVRKTLELLEGEDIASIKVFRESSIGAQKVLQPVERQGVKGGDVLGKMTHEVYVLDFLERAGNEPELEIEGAEAEYFMPKKPGSEKMMALDGGITDEIGQKVATARTSAAFDSSGTLVELHSSWVGLSDETRDAASKVREATGADVTDSGYSEISGRAFLDEEARFFIVEGSRNLVGDMLNKRLYDLDTGEEIDTPDLMHDQLYRVIEKAVLAAAGKEPGAEIGEKEVDVFMEAVFDVRKHAIEEAEEYLEELEAANSRLREMIVEDKEEEEVKA